MNSLRFTLIELGHGIIVGRFCWLPKSRCVGFPSWLARCNQQIELSRATFQAAQLSKPSTSTTPVDIHNVFQYVSFVCQAQGDCAKGTEFFVETRLPAKNGWPRLVVRAVALLRHPPLPAVRFFPPLRSCLPLFVAVQLATQKQRKQVAMQHAMSPSQGSPWTIPFQRTTSTTNTTTTTSQQQLQL